MLKAVSETPAGIELLRWICQLSGFNRSSCSLEEAARRDIWLTLRQFMPVERLSEVEHHELRETQQQLRELLIASQEVNLNGD